MGKSIWKTRMVNICIEKIKIPQEFRQTPPNSKKMEKKWEYYRKTGKLQSPILLTRDYVLVDGYTSYIIAYETDMGVAPVQFIDNACDDTKENTKNGN